MKASASGRAGITCSLTVYVYKRDDFDFCVNSDVYRLASQYLKVWYSHRYGEIASSTQASETHLQKHIASLMVNWTSFWKIIPLILLMHCRTIFLGLMSLLAANVSCFMQTLSCNDFRSRCVVCTQDAVASVRCFPAALCDVNIRLALPAGPGTHIQRYAF